jgi:hypothetical protein
MYHLMYNVKYLLRCICPTNITYLFLSMADNTTPKLDAVTRILRIWHQSGLHRWPTVRPWIVSRASLPTIKDLLSQVRGESAWIYPSLIRRSSTSGTGMDTTAGSGDIIQCWAAIVNGCCSEMLHLVTDNNIVVHLWKVHRNIKHQLKSKMRCFNFLHIYTLSLFILNLS